VFIKIILPQIGILV